MKTNSKLLLFAILAPLIASSCNKDESKLPFSELSVEQNKQVVENSAIDAARVLDAMKDHAAVDASVSLGTHLERAFPLELKAIKNSKALNTIDAVAAMGSKDANINVLFKELVSPEELADDPSSIQDVWDMVVGIYDWDATNEDWTVTENSEKVEINFPSTENGTTNDATFTIYNYTGVMIANPLDNEYSGDLPASLNIDLAVGDNIILSYTFAASYNSDGVPTSLATDLTLEPYKFSVDMSNNDKKATASYKLTNDKDVVIEISGTVEGDFTQDNIDANTETVTDTHTEYEWNPNTYQYEEVTVTSTYDQVTAQNIFQSGSFKFQLYNISINGNGDIKAIGDSLDLIYPDGYYNNQNFDEMKATEMEVALMNNNLHIYAIDENAKAKIAAVEAYMVTDNNDGYTNYWVDFRLVFGDGSLVDLETYFANGFDQFVAEINSMITDLNNKYDWALEPIDY